MTDTAASPALHEIRLVLGLMAVVAALVTLARRIELPYPILLVIGGLVLRLVPGLPRVALEPELVLLLFLPPILFSAAYFTSLRDFRANLRPISLLAVGAVLATAAAVAAVTQALVPGLGWAAAFALGAIVAPTDAVAATAVAQRLGVPRRLVTVIEGESLVNDATALVVYRMAVAAAVTGTFSLGEAALRFVLVSTGGVLIGLAVGWALVRLWARLDDPLVEILVSLLVPFVAYLPAEAIGVSGVLATVAAGMVAGRASPRVLDSEARLQGRAVWGTLIFIINGLVFILIGLQLSGILDRLSERELLWLVGVGALVSLTVILVRFAWVFPATYLPRYLIRSLRERDPYPPWQVVTLLAWAGLRGVVSLAAALALPVSIGGGSPFPERDQLVFLTFCVILVTLVGQGLTLPVLIRALGVGDVSAEEPEKLHARAAATEAAVARIEQLAQEWPDHLPLIETLRVQYAHRASHLGEQSDEGSGSDRDGAAERELLEHHRIRRAVINAEREALIDLRDRGVVNDEVFRHLERDLDLEELRMEA